MGGQQIESDPLQKDIHSTTKVYSYGDKDALNSTRGGRRSTEAFVLLHCMWKLRGTHPTRWSADAWQRRAGRMEFDYGTTSRLKVMAKKTTAQLVWRLVYNSVFEPFIVCAWPLTVHILFLNLNWLVSLTSLTFGNHWCLVYLYGKSNTWIVKHKSACMCKTKWTNFANISTSTTM